ncbi:hypothetical protein [Oceanobacillus damuensis]|nr:hypothetical protein [Oceanobacillus damuensis]
MDKAVPKQEKQKEHESHKSGDTQYIAREMVPSQLLNGNPTSN